MRHSIARTLAFVGFALTVGLAIGVVALSDAQLAGIRNKILHRRPTASAAILLTPAMRAYKERYVLGDVTIVEPAYFAHRVCRQPRAIAATLFALDDTVAVMTGDLDLGFQPRKESAP